MAISAQSGQGLDRLASAVSQTLSHNFLDLDVETGVENGRLLAQLAAVGEILSKRFTDTRVIVHCRVPERAVAHLYGEGVSIQPRGGAGQNGNGSGAVDTPRSLAWPLDGSRCRALIPMARGTSAASQLKFRLGTIGPSVSCLPARNHLRVWRRFVSPE